MCSIEGSLEGGVMACITGTEELSFCVFGICCCPAGFLEGADIIFLVG